MSAVRNRLPAPYGNAIDRAREVEFSFEGRRYTGLVGDTLTSALWSAGVRTLVRSFKYKRPRGAFSLTGFDGLLVQAGDEPNRPADRLPVAADMPHVLGQNYTGSLAYDRSAWIGLLGRFLPVGFYYRSFFRPKGAWAFFEPKVRRRAGMGRLKPDLHHAPQTDKQYLFCDLCVVGAGPAGLAAAFQAATLGADVLLVDAATDIGGSLRATSPDRAAKAGDLAARVRQAPNIRILTSAIAQGLYADNWLAIEAPERLYKVRATQVVVATGTFEQPLVFRNNDLPGVMLCSAARRLLWLYGVKPGDRAVVATADDEGVETAIELKAAGIDVAALVDLRAKSSRGPRHETCAQVGIAVMMATGIYEAIPASRPLGFYFGAPLAAVRLAQLTENGARPSAEPAISCDLLCLSGGFVPAAALLCHAGAQISYDEALRALSLGAVPAGIEAAGAVRGLRDLDQAVADGAAAGRAAAAALGLAPPAAAPRLSPAPGTGPLFPIIRHAKGKEFVDLDEDLTISDIENAVADGFEHVELLKRYSTAGMGPSQGKFSALAVMRVAAATRGLSPALLGTTTNRPPFTGMSMRLLAGRAFSPHRVTPMHERHLALGAEMMVAGAWYRPACYSKGLEREEAIRREVRAVHNGVGLIDVSTLGGIEVAGADAAAFINRIYTTPHLKQPVGRSRYVLLCEDGGAIVDDGVACRFGENRFYLTATTSAVDQTYRRMLWLNAQWRMKVDILNVTSAFAAINIAGPRSREVLARLDSDIDLSPEAFPYLDVRAGHIEGVPARVLRVGFVGELGYEIHVPTPYGLALWDQLTEAGAEAGVIPFGVEAQRLLRLEKGHIIVGQDTDGLTHPFEAGLDWAVPRNKPEYAGRAAIMAQVANGITRKLVGFRLEDASVPPPPECCLVLRGEEIAGRVTSAAFSEACGGVIGMAYVAPEDAAPGSRITIKEPSGRRVAARVVATPFYDPGHDRQKL